LSLCEYRPAVISGPGPAEFRRHSRDPSAAPGDNADAFGGETGATCMSVENIDAAATRTAARPASTASATARSSRPRPRGMVHRRASELRVVGGRARGRGARVASSEGRRSRSGSGAAAGFHQPAGDHARPHSRVAGGVKGFPHRRCLGLSQKHREIHHQITARRAPGHRAPDRARARHGAARAWRRAYKPEVRIVECHKPCASATNAPLQTASPLAGEFRPRGVRSRRPDSSERRGSQSLRPTRCWRRSSAAPVDAHAFDPRIEERSEC